MGAAVIEELVDGGAHRATGVKHIVNQNQSASLHIKADVRSADMRVQANAGEVVAIKVDAELAGVTLAAEKPNKPPHHLDAAALDSDKSRVVEAALVQPPLQPLRHIAQ